MNSARYFLIMSVVAWVALLPISAYGKGEAGKPPPADQMNTHPPPVEQPLVPEEVFAIQLAEALKMGPVEDEVQAENTLSSAGIEPKNGWIAGYPVTPPIMGEIEKGVAAAADAGKLKMGKAEALKAVADLKASLGLNIDPGAISQPVPGGGVGNSVVYKYTDRDGVIHFTDQYESIPMEYRGRVETIRGTVRPQTSVAPPPIAPTSGDSQVQPPEDISIPDPGPGVVNNYYYDSGPPVVTYYPPPLPYHYLYAWVPYPFWCRGFYFSGFFILHDFHRHGYCHKRPCVVTNHLVWHRKGYTVDPRNRNLRVGMMPHRIPPSQAYRPPGGQPGNRTVVGPGQKRTGPAAAPTPSRTPRVAPPTVTRAGPPAVTKAPSSPTMARPQGPLRPNQPVANFKPAPPRVSSPPAVSQGRIFNSPAPGSRGFSGGSQGGRSVGNGSFFGGGMRGNR